MYQEIDDVFTEVETSSTPSGQVVIKKTRRCGTLAQPRFQKNTGSNATYVRVEADVITECWLEEDGTFAEAQSHRPFNLVFTALANGDTTRWSVEGFPPALFTPAAVAWMSTNKSTWPLPCETTDPTAAQHNCETSSSGVVQKLWLQKGINPDLKNALFKTMKTMNLVTVNSILDTETRELLNGSVQKPTYKKTYTSPNKVTVADGKTTEFKKTGWRVGQIWLTSG
jgi:hypothetical protein